MPPDCSCQAPTHTPRLIAFTGGPGAGKTTVLEVARRAFCRHVVALPESASLLYGGGFPRGTSAPARRAAQRAIFHVQRELEQGALEEATAAVVLCDRGLLDGLAYWREDEGAFFAGVGTTRSAVLARYAAVVHLRTPEDGHGYDHKNRLRIETAEEARALDARTLEVWADHPRRIVIESSDDFLVKLASAVAVVRGELPACCQ